MAQEYLLAIDQGTTSTRAILFTAAGELSRTAQEELAQSIPRDGWAEHDPEAIWAATIRVAPSVMEGIGAARPRAGAMPPSANWTTPSAGLASTSMSLPRTRGRTWCAPAATNTCTTSDSGRSCLTCKKTPTN